VNRRDLLKALAAVGANAVLCDMLADHAEVQVAKGVPATGVFGIDEDRVDTLEALTDILVVGNEVASRMAAFTLRRVGATGSLISWYLNAYGGMLRWRAPPGADVMIVRDQYIELLGDFDGAAHLKTRTDGDVYRHYFWALSKADPPRLLGVESTKLRGTLNSSSLDDGELDALEARET
jgi:hypothetical protein